MTLLACAFVGAALYVAGLRIKRIAHRLFSELLDGVAVETP